MIIKKKREREKKQNTTTPTGLYKNGHIWTRHVLCCSDTVPCSTLYVVWR